MTTLQSFAVGALCAFVTVGGIVFLTRGDIAGGVVSILLAVAVLATSQWVWKRGRRP
jgi:hypothetical protein